MSDTKQLADILKSAKLKQHTQERTHRHGHILDFIIFHDDDNLIEDVSVSSILYDNFLISINVSSLFQLNLFHTGNISRSTRMLLLLICRSFLWYRNRHNSILKDFVDEHAPLRTKEMPGRPLRLWYNKDI